MLTEWALRERKWGSFPAMRQVLAVAPATDRHWGFTSVSDNVFAEQRRLVEIANQAEEHRGALLDAVHQTPELRAQMLEDLHHLQKQFTIKGSFQRPTTISTLKALLPSLRKS